MPKIYQHITKRQVDSCWIAVRQLLWRATCQEKQNLGGLDTHCTKIGQDSSDQAELDRVCCCSHFFHSFQQEILQGCREEQRTWSFWKSNMIRGKNWKRKDIQKFAELRLWSVPTQFSPRRNASFRFLQFAQASKHIFWHGQGRFERLCMCTACRWFEPGRKK